MKRFPFGQLLAISALTLLAGLTFTSVFLAQDVALLVLGAVFFPALLSLIVRSWPKPNLGIVLLAHVVLYLLFVSLIVFPDTAAGRLVPTGSTISAIGDGMRNGWAVILSSTVPVPALPSALFVPATLTWLAMLVGTEVLFRTRRVFPTLLPAITLGCAGILFSDGASGTFSMLGVAFMAVAAGLIAARASSFAADPRAFDDRELELARDGDDGFQTGLSGALLRHRLAMAAPFILVVVLLAVPVATRLPFVDTGEQTLLRDHYDVPKEDRRRITPLAEVAGEVGNDAVRYRVVFDQDVTGKPTLRTAVLDTFNGTTWSSSGTFVTTGAQLPPQIPVEAETARVGQRITVVDGRAPWLPVLARPLEIDVDPEVGVQVDPATSALYVPGGPEPGLTYSVTSELVTTTPEQLQRAGVAVDPSARSSTGTVGELPPEIAELQAEIFGPAASPFQQLARLLGFFRNNPAVNTGTPFTLNEDAAPNFSVTGITSFLTGKEARSGRPEQFAAAFATLARGAGFPARIVVGYQLPDRVERNSVIEVRARDLTAWPEVALDGLGWVALDPVPSDESTTELTVEEQQLEAVVNSAVDQSVNQPEERAAENPNLAEPPPPVDDSGRRVQFALVLLVAAAILVALLVLPWFQKRSRRSRRRSDADPARRTAGAWQEAMDRLVECDITEPRTFTTQQAAVLVDERFGAPAADALRSMGPLINQALHDRVPPDPAVADAAWRYEQDFEAAMRSVRRRSDRLRASLDRRPLAAAEKD